MKTLVVIPMKDPRASKTRLGVNIGHRPSAAIARLLFQRSLSRFVGLRAQLGFDLAVITASAEIAALTKRACATVIPDPGKGLNAALDVANRLAADQGYDQLCIFPADLAAPRSADLASVIHVDTKSPQVLICPATDGGTNAMRVPPMAMPFRFGKHSAARHAAAARRAGLSVELRQIDSLSRDIDTLSDLNRAACVDAELRVLA